MTGPSLLELEIDLDADELRAVFLKDTAFARGQVKLASMTREDQAWVLEHAKRLAQTFGATQGIFQLRLDEARQGYLPEPGRPWASLAAAEQERVRQSAAEVVQATYSLVVL